MPASKIKNRPSPDAATRSATQAIRHCEVLTLAEAAAYLRVAEPEVLRMIQEQGLPGRRIASEWRFLKSALQDWLRSPTPTFSKEALWSLAGAWKDDPQLDELVRNAYQRRGRPMTEDGE